VELPGQELEFSASRPHTVAESRTLVDFGVGGKNDQVHNIRVFKIALNIKVL
jgi:hypothetical protein